MVLSSGGLLVANSPMYSIRKPTNFCKKQKKKDTKN